MKEKLPPFYWSCILKPTRIKREYEKTIDKHILVQQQKIPQQGRWTKYPHKKKGSMFIRIPPLPAKKPQTSIFRGMLTQNDGSLHHHSSSPHFVVFVNKGYKNPQVWKQSQLKWRVFLILLITVSTNSDIVYLLKLVMKWQLPMPKKHFQGNKRFFSYCWWKKSRRSPVDR